MAFDSGKEGEDEEAIRWWRQRGIVRGENGFDYGGEEDRTRWRQRRQWRLWPCKVRKTLKLRKRRL